MRVAIVAVSLFLSGIAICQGSRAQELQASETSVLNGAVPAVAMNTPGFKVAELSVARPMLRREVSGRGTIPTVPRMLARAPVTAPAVVQGFNGPPLLLNDARPASAGVTLPSPPEQPSRSLTDHLLVGAVALMLIGYQLRRKHRVLRPHPFAT